MWRWVKRGNLRASITPGGHHRILKDDLESLMIEKGVFPLAPKRLQKNKILIVDDDRDTRVALNKAFSRHQYVTEDAADGFEAGIKVMQFAPDLIVLDLFMPGMDGFEVCRIVKGSALTSQIKILILTGFANNENRELIMKAGADLFLEKPANMDVLLQHVKELLLAGYLEANDDGREKVQSAPG